MVPLDISIQISITVRPLKASMPHCRAGLKKPHP
jgi:hypothetical protein